MNGDISQIIALKFLMIVYVTEAVEVVEVHTLAEYPTLDCYISVFFLLSMLMELFQGRG